MIHDYCAEYGDVLIHPLHRYDIAFLRKWRNDPELSRYLTKVGTISEEQQKAWYRAYTKDRDVLFWAVDYKRMRTVGSVALYDFRDTVCQIGKVVVGEKEARGHGIGKAAFLMAMKVGMDQLGIHTFQLSVHEDNIPAKKIYTALGFAQTGSHPFPQGGYEIEMEVMGDRVRELYPEMSGIWLFQENGEDISCPGGFDGA